MLLITEVSVQEDAITLKVEGWVAGDSVNGLTNVCRKWLQADCRVTLDFSGVTYVDAHGMARLRDLCGPQLTIIRCPPLIADSLRNGNDEPT